jgi:hypothetical protein
MSWLIIFPPQQWLHERTSVLPCTYFSCPVHKSVCCSPRGSCLYLTLYINVIVFSFFPDSQSWLQRNKHVYLGALGSGWCALCNCTVITVTDSGHCSFISKSQMRFIRLCSYHVLLTHSLTHSTQQSPSWETNRFSASQKNPRTLWNPEVHYRIHNSPTPVSIRSQLVQVIAPTFLKAHLNFILPSTPGSSKLALSLGFPHQNPVYASLLLHTRYMSRPYHFSQFYQQKNTGWEVQIIKLLIM